MEENGPLTTGNVASFCHVSQVTVFRWIKKGFLPAYTTPGGHYRIRPVDLVAFLEKQEMPVPGELAQMKADVRTVLLVDDDPTILEVLSKILTREKDLTVEIARGGYEACIKIGTLKPDLIVLDLLMPECDGFQVMREVRANPETKNCRILVLSGYGTQGNIDRAMGSGADHFLSKPVEALELINCVKSLLSS